MLESGVSEQGWAARRWDDARTWWADATPRTRKLTVGGAALAGVAFIGIVAAAANSGGSGAGAASAGKDGFEVEVGATELPPPEDCIIPDPHCMFEDSNLVDVCQEYIALGATGCAFEGECTVREECFCYDLPEFGCSSISKDDPEECVSFAACNFFEDACVDADDCPGLSNMPTVAPTGPTVSPTDAPTGPTESPTDSPDGRTISPADTAEPSMAPSQWPSQWPTAQPNDGSRTPSAAPSAAPSLWPTGAPTAAPNPNRPGWTP